MKQRVNIQYSIDMEDLQPEVNRLLNAAKHKIDNINTGFTTKFPSDLLNISTLSAIEDVRMELANIDFMLADITKIVNAYVSYRSQQIANEATAQEQSTSQEPVSHKQPEAALMDQTELLKKMEDLRKTYSSSAKFNDTTTQT